MGRNEYAKHRGCSPNAILKAVRSGRIAKAVVWDKGKIKAIKVQLADELWRQNTDVSRAPLRAPSASAAPQTSAHGATGPLQAGLGWAIADGFVAWAGLLVWHYNVDAEKAASMIADLHMTLAIAISERMGDVEKDSAMIVGDAKAALSPDAQPALLERIRAAAEAYREENPAG